MAKGWSWYIENDQRIRANRSLYHSHHWSITLSISLSLSLSLCVFLLLLAQRALRQSVKLMTRSQKSRRNRNRERMSNWSTKTRFIEKRRLVTNDVLIGSLIFARTAINYPERLSFAPESETRTRSFTSLAIICKTLKLIRFVRTQFQQLAIHSIWSDNSFQFARFLWKFSANISATRNEGGWLFRAGQNVQLNIRQGTAKYFNRYANIRNIAAQYDTCGHLLSKVSTNVWRKYISF